MGLDSVLAQHAHHAYGHSHHSQHEVHPLDDIFGWNHEPPVHFVYVGHAKGRYTERTRGTFDYIGPHKGDYEKEMLPADHTCRYIGVCFCLVLVALTAIALLHALLEDPPFECHVDVQHWERSWSTIKKEWCCENEAIACPYTPGEVTTTLVPIFEEDSAVVPVWLEKWLSNMNIGAKFIMTMSMALVLGCSCGAFGFYILVRYCVTPKKSRTELELMSEVNKLLAANNANGRGGELSITMMWDTSEDFDLHLVMPGSIGEISASCPEKAGFKLDGDANGNPLKATKTPMENIYWAPVADQPDVTPPEGEYQIWAKCGHNVLHADANLTVVKTIRGRREIFHHRIVPGTFEKRITTFTYKASSGSPTNG
mmetsp:Transcript_64348/g.184771  ORF Transcript_64348/g.184771 Transcript_64348/m.184771 type:complete len:369 (+) Transcript_64348:108-1214(+)